jgi:hypothetical protein
MFIILLLTFSLRGEGRDAGSITTKNFGDIDNLTSQLLKKIDPKEILIVFDIDNTLLKLNTDFGSEQWFMWQKNLIEKDLSTLPSITDSVDHLLTIQSWIYNDFPMTLVDVREKQWISKLHSFGSSIIALTSRSINVRDATLREINRNNLHLSTAKKLGFFEEGKDYRPYDLNHIETSGLKVSDIETFHLSESKVVMFDRGVFFTQGQHKGAMLKTFLAKIHHSFKAVIFIDDRIGHIEAMRKMATTVSQDIYSLHFNFSENWTVPFFLNSKEKVQDAWCSYSQKIDNERYPKPELRIYLSCQKS